MTQLSEEVVERVARNWFEEAQKAVPDWRYRPNWDEISEQSRQNYRDDVEFILDTSGQAELLDAVRWIDDNYGNQDMSHHDFRVGAAVRTGAALAKLCPNSDKPIISE